MRLFPELDSRRESDLESRGVCVGGCGRVCMCVVCVWLCVCGCVCMVVCVVVADVVVCVWLWLCVWLCVAVCTARAEGTLCLVATDGSRPPASSELPSTPDPSVIEESPWKAGVCTRGWKAHRVGSRDGVGMGWLCWGSPGKNLPWSPLCAQGP